MLKAVLLPQDEVLGGPLPDSASDVVFQHCQPFSLLYSHPGYHRRDLRTPEPGVAFTPTEDSPRG